MESKDKTLDLAQIIPSIIEIVFLKSLRRIRRISRLSLFHQKN